MVSVVKAGTALRYAIEPGVGGQPMTADSIRTIATIAGVEIHQNTVPYSVALVEGAVVPGSATLITGRRAFVTVTYEFLDEQGALIAMLVEEIILESNNLLLPAENSFADYQELMLDSFDMTDLGTFRSATKEEQLAALITAYYNIGSMSVSFFHHRDIDDQTSISPELLMKISSTRLLDAATLQALKPSIRLQLKRSQLAEAESLLGGNPIERQRVLGLLSHSAGESTHFYRTTKPLELPISKRAAVELRGIINYALRISR